MKDIKFNIPYLAGSENDYILDVFSEEFFAGNGKYTKKCHDILSNIVGQNNVLLTDSCTSALEICALLLRERNTSQEVIIPSYTFSSTAAAFLKMGFEVNFCDVNPNSMMIDDDHAISLINEKTCAIVAVHYGGDLAPLDKLSKSCSENDIFLIEDAAQALGCYRDNLHAGNESDFSCFSFHETKNLHAGLAGAFFTKHKDFYERATYIWERGTNRAAMLRGVVDKYTWVEVGGSYYPSELQAAFLYNQLENFDDNLDKRKKLHRNYENKFNIFESKGAKVNRQQIPQNIIHNGHAFWVKGNSIEHASKIISNLKDHNISAYIGYTPLHNSPVGQKHSKDINLIHTEKESELIIRLPIHNKMKESDVEYVSDMFLKFYE